jgi:hypothetical protein
MSLSTNKSSSHVHHSSNMLNWLAMTMVHGIEEQSCSSQYENSILF